MKGAFMKKFLFCCIILFVFIVGCERSTSPDVQSKIHGTVLDTNGNPVADAKILVNFNVDCDYPIGSMKGMGKKYNYTIKDSFIPGPPPPPPINYGIQNCPNPFTNLTRISFCLENSGIGSLWIEDFLGEGIDSLINNELFMADEFYSVNWNGENNDDNNIQNGLYIIALSIDTSTKKKVYTDSLFIFKDYNEFNYEEITTLYKTNQAGRFTIYTQDLPLYHIGDCYDSDGTHLGDFSVTPYIDIWAFHPDYALVHVDSILIESGKDINVSLSFE